MPEGLLVTVPLPTLVTLSRYLFSVKVAVTDLSPVIVKLDGLVLPVRLPLQDEKRYPALGLAVNCTLVEGIYSPPTQFGSGF